MMKRSLLVVVIGCLPALAQTADGILSGQIREPDGNPVASVRVSLVGMGGTLNIQPYADCLLRPVRST